MEQHNCLFCMGSNYQKESHLSLARQLIANRFPTVKFGKTMITEPLYFSNPDLFLNQLGFFTTSLAMEEVVSIFKNIEKKIGKLPTDKKQETVKLDIDLLLYDTQVLKPSDMEREYVKRGMKEIKEILLFRKIHVPFSQLEM